jgi:hypothetical protein
MARRRKTPAPLPPLPVGEGGWPINDRRDEAAIERERVQHEVAFLKTLERDVVKNEHFPSLMDALAFCRGRTLPLPPWLHERICAILDHWYNAKQKNWKRHEEERARREKHLRRHEAVMDLLDRRDELTEFFQRVGDPEPDVKYETAFNKAAEHLKEKNKHCPGQLFEGPAPTQKVWWLALSRAVSRSANQCKKTPQKTLVFCTETMGKTALVEFSVQQPGVRPHACSAPFALRRSDRTRHRSQSHHPEKLDRSARLSDRPAHGAEYANLGRGRSSAVDR